MKKVTANAIEHTDVRGKKQWYVKLSNGENDHIISVGENTYNKVRDLETVQTAELSLTEKTEKKK